VKRKCFAIGIIEFGYIIIDLGMKKMHFIFLPVVFLEIIQTYIICLYIVYSKNSIDRKGLSRQTNNYKVYHNFLPSSGAIRIGDGPNTGPL
jgi:hypothetical protein